MLEQAQDFLDEAQALHALIAPLDDEALCQPTGFKGWTVNHIIGHLHLWNIAADLALTDPEAFRKMFARVAASLKSGTLRTFEEQWLDGRNGEALVEEWIAFSREMTARFHAADPSARVEWAGPSMSIRSSITARLMETWAHGQAIYDLLKVQRTDTDRIKNIVVLGNNTYAWTFRVNGKDAPDPKPHLKLSAPSGVVWTFNEESQNETIEGLASEFCQVVTQTRNIADTNLVCTGDNATEWMRIAQCFAGQRETPPAPGTRG